MSKIPTQMVVIDDHILRRDAIAAILSRQIKEIGDQTAQVEACQIEDVDNLLSSEQRSVGIYIIGAEPIDKPQILENLTTLLIAFGAQPLLILVDEVDAESIDTAVTLGVAGVISTRMASHIAVAAIEFVQAGGRYYPHTPIRGQSAPTFQVAWSALSDADQTDVQPCSPEIEIESPSSSLGPHGGSESNEENHSELRFDWQALHLTPRQMDVLHSLERGLSNKTIGKELALSESTVKLHVRHLMRKLRVRNRTQIALLASAAQRGHDPS